MPPKKPGPVDKKKAQAQADATFGMKNKKGKKAQMVAKSTQVGGSKEERAKQEAAMRRKAEKEEQKKIDAENALLFRKVEEKQKPQLVPPGVDPKSVLCLYFKRGNCQAGDQCKLAHDLSVEGKKQKADMFTDARSQKFDEESLKNQDMSQWDEETLKRMLAKKAAERPNASEKVCRQFLQAVEGKRWGWLWVCPNGGDRCPYKHALPPDYKFKSDKKAEKVEARPLEEIIEEERSKLPSSGGIKVNPETFAAWSEKIKKQKEEEQSKNAASRQKALKSGAKMTGREFFSQEGLQIDEGEDKSEGEDVDLLALRREKEKEEEALDAENARLAAELNAAVEEELAERERNGEILDPNKEKEPPAPTVEDDVKETPINPTTLENVDTSLFTEEVDDIPDDFSDEN